MLAIDAYSVIAHTVESPMWLPTALTWAGLPRLHRASIYTGSDQELQQLHKRNCFDFSAEEVTAPTTTTAGLASTTLTDTTTIIMGPPYLATCETLLSIGATTLSVWEMANVASRADSGSALKYRFAGPIAGNLVDGASPCTDFLSTRADQGTPADRSNYGPRSSPRKNPRPRRSIMAMRQGLCVRFVS